jgi:asparagine synthase (glutamine-hydrolysing)
MSAVSVIYNLDGRPVERGEMHAVLDSLAHRGDDDQGMWIGGNIGLGHRMRWTTPESLQEKLPLRSAESSAVITCDARIDNRDELIPQLSFRSKPIDEITDSEIVLKAYEKWGEDCLPKLVGDFVFVIWDPRENKLFCARDPLGLKHFYYYHLPGEFFALASEIKALRKLKNVACELDEECLADYLIINTENKRNTFYKNILRLPATHALVVNQSGLRIWKYWQPQSAEIKLKSDTEYQEAFREKFTQAVNCRLRSAYPVGSTLSGGLDSSAVVCVASQLLKNARRPPLHAFLGIFPTVSKIDPRIDEMRYMRSVIEKSGCEPHFVNADDVNPLQDSDKIIHHTDQPTGHMNAFMAFEIFKAAHAKDVRILLSGHDGDCTVSHGYEDFEALARRGRYFRLFKEAIALQKNMPYTRHTIKHLAWQRGIKPTVPSSLINMWRILRRRKPRDSKPSPVRYPLHFDSINEEFWKRSDLEERTTRYQKLSYPEGASRVDHHWSVLTNGVFAAMHEQGENLSAAYGIEQRHPFFDRRLIEFCGALPPGQRLYRGWTRSIFRFAMQDILPPDVQWRTDKAILGAQIKVNLFKYKSKELEKIPRQNVEKLGKYINVEKLRAAYRSCLTDPNAKDQEVLLVLTSVYLLGWLERSGASCN